MLHRAIAFDASLVPIDFCVSPVHSFYPIGPTSFPVRLADQSGLEDTGVGVSGGGSGGDGSGPENISHAEKAKRECLLWGHIALYSFVPTPVRSTCWWLCVTIPTGKTYTNVIARWIRNNGGEGICIIANQRHVCSLGCSYSPLPKIAPCGMTCAIQMPRPSQLLV